MTVHHITVEMQLHCLWVNLNFSAAEKLNNHYGHAFLIIS